MPLAVRSQLHDEAPLVARVALASHQTALFEPLKNARHRLRAQVQGIGQFARRATARAGQLAERADLRRRQAALGQKLAGASVNCLGDLPQGGDDLIMLRHGSWHDLCSPSNGW